METTYEKPSMKFYEFFVEDIITTSNSQPFGENGVIDELDDEEQEQQNGGL